MKKIIQLSAVLILMMGMMVPESDAQTRKKYNNVNTLEIPSYLHYLMRDNYLIPESFEATATSQYYYDDDDNKIIDGTIKIKGGYAPPKERSAAVYYYPHYNSYIDITAASSEGVMEGPFKAKYHESYLNETTLDLSLNTIFLEGKMTGSMVMRSNVILYGQEEVKSHWIFQMDEHSNITSIDCVVGNAICKVSLNTIGEATGVISYNGQEFKLHESIILNYFNRKTGELCVCEEEQSKLLTKYSKGECTIEDIMKAGYIFKKIDNLEISIDEYTAKCMNLGLSEFGKFAKQSFPLYILQRTDIYSYEELLPLLTPDDNTYPISWDVKYDDSSNQIIFSQMYNSWERYVTPSDAKRFIAAVDSVARKECHIIASYFCESAGKRVEYSQLKSQYLGREIYWCEEPDYKSVSIYGNNTYKITDIVRYDSMMEYDVHIELKAHKSHADGPKERKIVLNVGMSNNGRDLYIDLISNKHIPTMWDSYREEKASVKQSFKKIFTRAEEYDKMSYDNLVAFYHTYDMNAKESYDESMKSLKYLMDVISDFEKDHERRSSIMADNQKVLNILGKYPEILNAYNEHLSSINAAWTANGTNDLEAIRTLIQQTESFIIKKEQFDKNSADIIKNIGTLNDVMSSYNQFVTSSDTQWKPGRDGSQFDELIQKQKQIGIFVAKRQDIASNHLKINNSHKNANNVYNAYESFMTVADVSLDDDIDINKLDYIIKVQTATYSIITKPEIKKINSSIKKEKLTDITDIITYVNQHFQYTSGSDLTELVDTIEADKDLYTGTSSDSNAIGSKTVTKIKPRATSSGDEPRFRQYISAAGMTHFDNDASGFTASINYIGGYNINEKLFVGLGLGINLNEDDGKAYAEGYGTENPYYRVYYYPHSGISFPIYLNLRMNLGDNNKTWNPYMSISAGYHISMAPIGSALPNYHFDYTHQFGLSMTNQKNQGIMGEISVGMSKKLNDRRSLYYGIGFKAEKRMEDMECEKYGISGWGKATVCAAKFTVGISF